jgi:hypothetical protein
MILVVLAFLAFVMKLVSTGANFKRLDNVKSFFLAGVFLYTLGMLVKIWL